MMTPTRVLLVASFPLRPVYTSVQMRMQAITRSLLEGGFDVKRLYISANPSTSPHADDPSCICDKAEFELPLGDTDLQGVSTACGGIGSDLNQVYLENLLRSFRPHVIACEGPHAWPSVKACLARVNIASPRIIYSFYPQLSSICVEKYISMEAECHDIRVLSLAERELIAVADGLVASGDADFFALSRLNKPLFLAQNGSEYDLGAVESVYWQDRLCCYSAALYFGDVSAANAHVFAKFVGPSLSYLSPLERILVTGEAEDALARIGFFDDRLGVNASRTVRCGKQNQVEVQAIYSAAASFVLPCGSMPSCSVEVATAVSSGKPVIATTAAFRGFERLTSLSNVMIYDDPCEFKFVVRKSLRSGHTREKSMLGDGALSRLLSWRCTLQRFPAFVMAVSNDGRSSSELGVRADGATVCSFQGSDLSQILESGWHPLEADGTWSFRSVASLVVTMPGGKGNFWTVRLELEGFPGSAETQKISIFSTRRFLLTYALNARYKIYTVEFRVDECDLLGEELVLYLVSLALWSPEDLGEGADKRKLGIRLRSIEIKSGVDCGTS